MKGEERLESIRVIVDEMLMKMKDLEERRCATIHLYGVSEISSVLALKRGLDPELASISAMLHDYYVYLTGYKEYHDQNGAEIVRPIIRDLGLFTKEEQFIILSAIFHHSDKNNTHEPYDELLKDADILQHYLYNVHSHVNEPNRKRLKRILKELGLPYEFNTIVIEPKQETIIENKRYLLGDIAETMAKREIIGIPSNKEYLDICLYYSGDNTYKELMNGWCAAFVYYCIRKAGFNLPIRYPKVMCRFAGVVGWLDWAQLPEINFFHSVKEKDFLPARGDLVIYDKLITNNLHDHIGIILECREDELVVAEGNIDNKNKSGVVIRNRFEKIAGFIRINQNYTYQYHDKYII